MGFQQGRYSVKKQEKYLGDPNNIIYRSSWELKMFNYCDFNPSVLKWNSEDVVVPYFWEGDNKMHRYYVDLYMEVQTNNGIKKFLVEIKPKKDCEVKAPTKMTEKAKQRYIENIMTVSKNKAKWAAATKFAIERGLQFVVITEDELFG
jgi:hypothetical protein